jgi:general secretion pathway protein F
MPAFKFEALDAAGSTSGLLEAESPSGALAVARPGAGALGRHSGRHRRHPTGGLRIGGRVRFHQPRGLDPAARRPGGLGLPLERALSALGDEAEDRKQRELVAHLRSEVNSGSPFARALASAPREFDEVYRGVVAAGEQSGALGRVLERLADDLEARQELKGKLIGATLYPAIVSAIAVVIVIFLVTTSCRRWRRCSPARSGRQFTVAMLGISHFAQLGWLLLIAIAGGVGALLMALRNEPFRERFDAGWLNLPLIGRLSRGYNAARFAGTLAMLAGAGVPILKALQAAAETLSNRAMRADAMDALVQVREGAPLASALAGKKRFPGILAMFSRLGEQTGQLPTMLERAAKQLSAEVQRRAMQMATILEPLLIVGMGGVVMLIVLAVLLPIIQLNSFVK